MKSKIVRTMLTVLALAVFAFAASTPVLESGLSTTVQTVSSSRALLTSYECYNPNAAVAYVQVFDTTATVTLGTTLPNWSFGIPATQRASLADLNMLFKSGIKVAATTTATGNTANASALDCNFAIN